MSQQPGYYPQQQYPPQPQYAPPAQHYQQQPVQQYPPQAQQYRQPAQQFPPQPAVSQQPKVQLPGNPNGTLMGGNGEPSVPALQLGKKWQAAGEWRGGVIVSPLVEYHVHKPVRKGTETEYEPQFYPKSGDPIIAVYVDVQTDVRDPSIEGDDGVRRMYIEGSLKTDQYVSRRGAVVDAVRKVGAAAPAQGGRLFLAWTHEVDTGAPSPAQSWQGHYDAPAAGTLMGPGQTAPVQQQAAPQVQPQYAPQQPQYAAPAAPMQAQQLMQAQQYAAPVHPQQQYAPVPQQYAPPAGPPVPQPQAAPSPEAAAALGNLSPEQMAALQTLGAQPGQPINPPF